MISLKNPNTKVKLILEVLTPLHVGGDSENHFKEGFDYVIRNKKLCVIDWKKTVENPKEVDKYVSMLSGNGLNSNDNSLRFSETYPLPKGVGSSDLKRLIRNGLGKPYIPGSSIKGSVLSSLISYLIKGIPRNPNDLLNSTVGSFQNSLQQFLRISDVTPHHKSIYLGKLFNLREENNQWLPGWKHGNRNTTGRLEPEKFSTLWEGFSPQQGAEITISFGRAFPKTENVVLAQLSEPAKMMYKSIFEKGDFKELFKIINKQTLKYLKAESAYFAEFVAGTNDKTYHLYQSYIELLESDPNDFCILRMASGSGYHSITGNWQFPENHRFLENPKNPTARAPFNKSRRVALLPKADGWEGWPMGYIMIQSPEHWEQRSISYEVPESTVEEIEELEAPIVAPKEIVPELRSIEDFSKSGGIVDAEVVGQKGMQMEVKLFLKNRENEIFTTRYPDGLDFFGKGKLITLALTFPNSKNRKQFNLSGPKIKE